MLVTLIAGFVSGFSGSWDTFDCCVSVTCGLAGFDLVLFGIEEDSKLIDDCGVLSTVRIVDVWTIQ